MARLKIQERIFIVETMNATKSLTATRRKFNSKFGRDVNLKTITANVKKLKELGTVQDCHKANSGRPKSGRSPENRDKVISLVDSNSKMSIRRIAFASSLKPTTVHNILKKELRLKPYKPQISQELKEGDDMKRLRFATELKK